MEFVNAPIHLLEKTVKIVILIIWKAEIHLVTLYVNLTQDTVQMNFVTAMVNVLKEVANLNAYATLSLLENTVRSALIRHSVIHYAMKMIFLIFHQKKKN